MADRFDLDAIEADDALLDLLAAGGESAWEAGEHDPALKLLAGLRLAVEVEDELPVETIDDPESFLARCAALNPVTDPFARKMAARGMVLGVAAVAALSVSGVAAAVTGDPLSPYEKVIEKVVEGLRPETSFPAEQLDGMPVVDKSKIVKVAKDFREKQEQAKTTGQDLKDNSLSIEFPPTDVEGVPKPPLARPTPPPEEKPTVKETVVPPAEPTQPPVQPVDEPTSEPTDEPTEPTTPPPTEPTDEPTPTTEPTDPPSTPTAEPTDPPTNDGSTGNGSTGNPTSGETPGGQPSGNPTTDSQQDAPAGGTETGGAETGGTQAEAGGTEQTAPTEQQAVELPVQDVPVQDKPVEPVQEKPAEPVQEKPAEPVQEKPAEPAEEKPAEELTSRVEQYFGKCHEATGKHSNGKGSVGYAKAQYAKGKHSSGQYAEGKHAAIDRAHGSMASVTLRQILSVVNTPTSSS